MGLLPIKKFWSAAFLGSCIFLFACENDINEVNNQFTKKAAVEEAFKIESFLSQGGRVKARLISPYMKRYIADSPYLEFPKTLHVDFFGDSTTIIESTLDARYARQIEFERKVLLRDSVLVINKLNGDTLRTSELWWDQNKEEFYTTKVAYINQRSGYSVAKNGLTAKQDFSEWWQFSTSGQRLVSDSITVQ